MKTHSGEKSQKCNQCDYVSVRADIMRKHLRTHAGEKLHKCNQCDFAAVEAGNLRKHLKIHSGEKPNKGDIQQLAQDRKYKKVSNDHAISRNHLLDHTDLMTFLFNCS